MDQTHRRLEKSELPDLAETLADVQTAPFLWPVYLQLAGLALENLAKGIAVARDPSLVAPDSKGRFRPQVGPHQRRSLFEASMSGTPSSSGPAG